MKLFRASLMTAGAALGLSLVSVWAAPFDDGNKPVSATFSPYVQKSDQHSQTDIGLEVDLGSRINLETPNADGKIDWVSRMRGNMPGNKDQNSRLLQSIKFGPQWSQKLASGRAWLGAAAGVESNGSNKGHQRMAGFSTGLYVPGLFTAEDPFQVEVQHGVVTPLSDANRVALGGNLSSYQRWELEANYRFGLGNAWVPSATLGLRHFQQSQFSAADTTKGRNRLGIIRFQLPQQFFVQLDRGTMPLDPYQSKSTAWRLGWEYQLR